LSGGRCLQLALLLALAAGGCRRADHAEQASAGSVADTPHVAPEEETYFTDVPVEGFDALTPDGQAAVAARANRAKCECGCFGHSVNACLHAKETCDTAVRTAAQFISDARLAESVAGLAPAGGETPDAEKLVVPESTPKSAATEPGSATAGGAAPASGVPRGPDAPLFEGAPPIVVVTPPVDPLAPAGDAGATAATAPVADAASGSAAASAAAPAAASATAPFDAMPPMRGPGSAPLPTAPNLVVGAVPLATVPGTATATAPIPGSPTGAVPNPPAGLVAPAPGLVQPLPGAGPQPPAGITPPAGQVTPGRVVPGQVQPGANAPPGSTAPAPASPTGGGP
jgi:hypothetical protein